MKFIDYMNLDDFYSIQDLCKLLDLSKQKVKEYCSKLELEPEKENCVYGFSKHKVRKLHNHIYQEEKQSPTLQGAFCWEEDPWND